MKFSEGDRVKLRVEKNYTDKTVIPAGTKGSVEIVYPTSESYKVKFKGFAKSRRVPEADLVADLDPA